MKVQFFVYFVLLGTAKCFPRYATLSSGSSQPDQTLVSVIHDFFEKKCDQNKNVSDVMEATVSCLNNYLPKNLNELKETPKQDALKNLCSSAEKFAKVRNCFSEFKGLLDECTVPAEKFLQDFFFELLDKFIEQLCSGGDGGYGVLFLPTTVSCLETSSAQMNSACGATLGVFQPGIVLTKPALVGDINKIKGCYNNYLSTNCIPATELKGFATKSFLTVKSTSIYQPVPVRPATRTVVENTPAVYRPSLLPPCPGCRDILNGLGGSSSILPAGSFLPSIPLLMPLPIPLIG